MATPRRKCCLADTNHSDIDLRDYGKIITDEAVVPHPLFLFKYLIFRHCFKRIVSLRTNAVNDKINPLLSDIHCRGVCMVLRLLLFRENDRRAD